MRAPVYMRLGLAVAAGAVAVAVDEATALASGLAVREVAEITVKGRAAPVRVYTLAEN